MFYVSSDDEGGGGRYYFTFFLWGDWDQWEGEMGSLWFYLSTRLNLGKRLGTFYLPFSFLGMAFICCVGGEGGRREEERRDEEVK